jgi:hypothetical protein
MSLFNSGPLKIAFGFGLGLVTAEIAKQMMPAFRGLGKPLLKAAVKSGVILTQQGRVHFAELQETLADLRAEVQAEMAVEAGAAEKAAELSRETVNGQGTVVGHPEAVFQAGVRH